MKDTGTYGIIFKVKQKTPELNQYGTGTYTGTNTF